MTASPNAETKRRPYAKRISVAERTAHIQRGEMWCPRCRSFKTFSNFNKDKYKDFGIQTTCAVCFNVRRAQIRNKSQDKERTERLRVSPKDIPDKKLCPTCNVVKDQSDFYRSSIRKTGLDPYCKECKKAKKRVYNREARDKRAEYARVYNTRNPLRAVAKQSRRRARKAEAGGTFTVEQVKLLLAYYAPAGKCLCCNQVRKLELDHVIPVIRQGTGFIFNIQPLCRRCNAEKHDSIIDYRSDRGKYAINLYRDGQCLIQLALVQS